MWKNLVKIGRLFLEMIYKCCQCIITILLHVTRCLRKGMTLSFNKLKFKLEFLLPINYLWVKRFKFIEMKGHVHSQGKIFEILHCARLTVEIWCGVLANIFKMSLMYMCFCFFDIIFSLKRVCPFIWTNMNLLFSIIVIVICIHDICSCRNLNAQLLWEF